MLKNYYFSNFNNNNVNIYTIDGLVNLQHPEFSHMKTIQVLGGLDTPENHSTSVASVIVGKNIGIIRNPNIPLYNYAACLHHCDEDLLWRGLVVIYTHLNQSGRRGVINLSWDFPYTDDCGEYDSIFKNIISIGGIIVNSAGNHDRNACTSDPACSSYVISVGSYDKYWTRSSFSNYGSCIDTWAPGSHIFTAYWHKYAYVSGTSFAAPAVMIL